METLFDEVDLNFSEDCFRISLVSLRMQSDSDLDSNIHTDRSQQASVKYNLDNCADSDPVRCYSSGCCKLPKSGCDEVVGSAENPHTDVTLGEFTDLMTLLKRAVPEHPTETDNNAETLRASVTDNVMSSKSFAVPDSVIPASVDITDINSKKLSLINDDTGSVVHRVTLAASDTNVPDNTTTAQPGTDDEEKVKLTAQPVSDEEEKVKLTAQPVSDEEEKVKLTAQPQSETGSDGEEKGAVQPGTDDEIARELLDLLNTGLMPQLDRGQEFDTHSDTMPQLDQEFDPDTGLMRQLDQELYIALALTGGDEDLTDYEEELLSHVRPGSECAVCLDFRRNEYRFCCQFNICHECFSTYVGTKVSEGIVVNIQCPNFQCYTPLSEFEISTHLSINLKMKYHQFVIDSRNDPTEKTCPRCGQEQHVDRKILKKKSTAQNGLPVTCQTCALCWCFTCHAPWHEGITCKVFRQGDKDFRYWTRQIDDDSMRCQANARQCPFCKMFIQRKGGCPHMTCSRCATDFCYDCGQRYYLARTEDSVLNSKAVRLLLGGHKSKLSPMGCRKNFLPDNKAARRLIRGSVMGVRLLGGVCVLTLGAGVAVVAVGLSPVIWCSLHLRKKIKERRARRRDLFSRVGHPSL